MLQNKEVIVSDIHRFIKFYDFDDYFFNTLNNLPTDINIFVEQNDFIEPLSDDYKNRLLSIKNLNVPAYRKQYYDLCKYVYCFDGVDITRTPIIIHFMKKL